MARPKLGESDSKRLQMVITEDELTAINEWQHANHIASKSEAIRRLCQIGLRSLRHMEGLGEAIYRASDQVSHINEQWRVLIDRHPDSKDIEYYAYEFYSMIHHAMGPLEHSVFDAHDRFSDFGNETNAVVHATTVRDAIDAADQEAGDAAKHRMQVEMERAEVDRLRKEKSK
jgi:hypothetical protein